jgi:hypothetical protein
LHNLVSCAGTACRARPAVRFTAGRHGRCGAVTATASASGVQNATFYVDGRRVVTDYRSPFRARLQFEKRAVVRARVVLAYDRLVTLDRVVRGCS